jgi:N-sulfoglucosamine sulfohydrolase
MLKRRFILCATLMLIGQSLTPALVSASTPNPSTSSPITPTSIFPGDPGDKHTTIGWVNDEGYPHIWHYDHGWLNVSGESQASIFVWDAALDSWLWTGSKVYPWFYCLEGYRNGGWLFYYTSSKGPVRWFRDMLTGRDFSVSKNIKLGTRPKERDPNDKRPNVVFIMADDASADDLGCYGNPTVRTPAIDSLAADGLRFDNAFAVTSSCAPSRGSVILSRWPHATGMAELRTDLRPDKERLEAFVARLDNLPQMLRKAGYHTIQSGKWHMGGLYQWVTPEGHFRQYFDSSEKVALSIQGGAYEWVDLLRKRPRNQPFFCWFSTFDPHFPWDGATGEHDPREIELPPYVPDTPYNREHFGYYFDEMSRWDRYVRAVVDELDRQGVLDNTIIVLTSDNGRPFARSKLTLFDSGTRVPLIVHWPDGIDQPGSTSSSLVTLMDLAPTFLEFAEVETAASTFQGRSFAKLIAEDPQDSFRSEVFLQQNNHSVETYMRAVRDPNFLYIIDHRPAEKPESGDFVELLFDVQEDPHQMNNLARSGQHQAELERLRKRLADWTEQTGDTLPEQLTGDLRQWDSMSEEERAALTGEQPGWEYWKDKSDAEIRAEAKVTRERF